MLYDYTARSDVEVTVTANMRVEEVGGKREWW